MINSKIVLLRNSFYFKKNIRHLFLRSSDNYKPVDGLRALSILYIVLLHSFYFLQFFIKHDVFVAFLSSFPKYLSWIWHGAKGVDMLFVISGFLIGGILMREYQKHHELNITHFYLRRYIRLMPVYAVALLAHYFIFKGRNIEYVWANLLYINNFLPVEKMYMGWSWFLSVIGQFYLIFPIFLLFVFYKTRYKLMSLVFLFLISFFVRYFVCLAHPSLINLSYCSFIFPTFPNYNTDFFNLLYTKTYTSYGALVCGVIVAYLDINYSQKLTSFFAKKTIVVNTLIILTICLILSCIFVPLYYPQIELSTNFKLLYFTAGGNLFSLGIAFILLCALYPNGLGKIVSRFLSLTFWYPIGQLSYSIYLFHIIVIMVLYGSALFPHGIPNIPIYLVLMGAVVVFIIAWLISVFIYLAVEKPFMNLRKK